MRRVVVTGGSGGIGQRVVDAFLADGCHVVDLDLRARTAGTPAAGRLDTIEVDVSDAAALAAAFARLDEVFAGRPPEVLVCCASIAKVHAFLDVELADLDRMLAVNVRGTFLVCQQAARRMRDGGGGGHIVVITSICDSVGWAREPVYGLTKSAQLGIVRSLAVELAPYGIAVNAVAPAAVEVESVGMAATRDAGDGRAQMLRRTPAGRLAAPEDVVAAIRFLASSSYVTGERLVVDGGFLATGMAYEGATAP